MKTCEWCKKDYEGVGKRFCGNSCSNRYKHSQRPKKSPKIKVCQECKKEFSGYGKKFCTLNCAARKNNEHKARDYFCKGCKLFLSRGWPKSKYCDKCRFDSNKNGNWKDWTKITIKSFKEKINNTYQFHARIRGLARQNYSRLNKEKKCQKCNYDKFVEICHKKSIASFDENCSIAEVNNVENLISLCPNCHWEFDNL